MDETTAGWDLLVRGERGQKPEGVEMPDGFALLPIMAAGTQGGSDPEQGSAQDGGWGDKCAKAKQLAASFGSRWSGCAQGGQEKFQGVAG